MKRLLALACAALVSGCATIAGGTSQEVKVETSPVGADCLLEREKMVLGHVNPTPGSMTVEKAYGDIDISCTKAEHQPGLATSKSGVEPWVFGNIIFGGLIGLGIDHATGGVNKYDSPVHVNLAPEAAVPPVTQPPTPTTESQPVPPAELQPAPVTPSPTS